MVGRIVEVDPLSSGVVGLDEEIAMFASEGVSLFAFSAETAFFFLLVRLLFFDLTMASSSRLRAPVDFPTLDLMDLQSLGSSRRNWGWVKTFDSGLNLYEASVSVGNCKYIAAVPA